MNKFLDVNLRDVRLKEALQSRLLGEMRLNNSGLHETGGGCALWAKRDWVKAAADGSRAGRAVKV